MIEEKYELYLDSVLCARDMSIDCTLILVRALFNEYYNESKMEVTIKKMERVIKDDDFR